MPIYEYRCADCGFQDEFLQKHSEPPMSVCPSCGKEALKKLLSAAGFQLKGSGWYATDFKGSGSKPVSKTGESDKSAAEGKGKGMDEGSGDKAAGDKPAADKPANASDKKSDTKPADKASGGGAADTSKSSKTSSTPASS